MDFVNEAYLKGGRQPLYHYTRITHLSKIMETDTLKVSRVSRPRNTTSICLTRSPYFTHDGGSLTAPRIVLDSDKLRKHGYNSLPVDEIGIAGKGMDKNFTKSNFKNIKSGKRPVHSGLDLPSPVGSTNMGLEVEYEERIHKDIKDVGKYIISIEFYNESEIRRLHGLSDYLEKYPHIVINVYDTKKREQTTDITDKVFNKERVKSL